MEGDPTADEAVLFEERARVPLRWVAGGVAALFTGLIAAQIWPPRALLPTGTVTAGSALVTGAAALVIGLAASAFLGRVTLQVTSTAVRVRPGAFWIGRSEIHRLLELRGEEVTRVRRAMLPDSTYVACAPWRSTAVLLEVDAPGRIARTPDGRMELVDGEGRVPCLIAVEDTEAFRSALGLPWSERADVILPG